MNKEQTLCKRLLNKLTSRVRELGELAFLYVYLSLASLCGEEGE